MSFKYPVDLDLSKNGVITFHPYKWILLDRGSQMTSSKKESDGNTIILPIQADMTISQPENWTEGEGGLIIGSSKDVREKIKGILRSVMGKAEDKLLGTIGQNYALNAARNKRGWITDDFLALTYAGVPLFENTFTFSFIPKNAKEASIIENIIYEFRVKSLPEMGGGRIHYPDVWDIDIRVAGKRIMRYPYCAITDVSTNYNPEGHIHLSKDGNLMRVDLTISIKQVAQIDKSDMAKRILGGG